MKKWDRALSGVAALGGLWWLVDAVAALIGGEELVLSGFSLVGVGLIVASRALGWALEALTGERF